jgi:copper oxidase (laccase) domain-containing protein
VFDAFCATDSGATSSFVPHRDGKWLADLYGLAKLRLGRAGVTNVAGGGHCTMTESERFFSWRRDKGPGRMATLVWLAAGA